MMKKITWSVCYGADFNVTDLFEEVWDAIEEAIASEEDFETDWVTTKKECGDWKLSRISGDYTIQLRYKVSKADMVFDAYYVSCFCGVCPYSEKEINEIIRKSKASLEFYNVVCLRGNNKEYSLNEILGEVSKLESKIYARYCKERKLVEKAIWDMKER